MRARNFIMDGISTDDLVAYTVTKFDRICADMKNVDQMTVIVDCCGASRANLYLRHLKAAFSVM